MIFTASGSKDFTICVDLNPAFSCLSFPENFHRARMNSIDLFPELTGKPVTRIEPLRFERAFRIFFEDELSLLFKIFGNQGNIILFQEDRLISLFKKNKKKDLNTSLEALAKTPDLSYESFSASGYNPGKFLPVLDKKMMEYIARQDFKTLAPHERYERLLETIESLENNPVFYVTENMGIPEFSLFQPEEIKFSRFEDVLKALTFFYRSRIHAASFYIEKNALLHSLEKEIEKLNNYIKNAEEKLKSLTTQSGYKKMADNIMANLQGIDPGSDEVVLRDIYTGQTIQIPLKKNLSPQKNAEVYYRKSKNQEIEIGKIEENIKAKKSGIKKLENRIREIHNISELKDLRKLSSGKDPAGNIKNQMFPFKKFIWMDFDILIGKNSENNEQLTFQAGYKEDLWLHAKDVAGSHVLIKWKAGKNFPRPVIQKAAELAAYFSKNRNNSLCPVIYTPKKFVRKLKGGRKGEVIVEREEIIFVKPGI